MTQDTRSYFDNLFLQIRPLCNDASCTKSSNYTTSHWFTVGKPKPVHIEGKFQLFDLQQNSFHLVYTCFNGIHYFSTRRCIPVTNNVIQSSRVSIRRKWSFYCSDPVRITLLLSLEKPLVS